MVARQGRQMKSRAGDAGSIQIASSISWPRRDLAGHVDAIDVGPDAESRVSFAATASKATRAAGPNP